MKKNTILIGDEELTEEMLVEILSRYWKKNSLNLMIAVAISFLGTLLSGISFLFEIENYSVIERATKGIGTTFLVITWVKSDRAYSKFRKNETFNSTYRRMLPLRNRLSLLVIITLYIIVASALYNLLGPISGLPSGFTIQIIIHLGLILFAALIFFYRHSERQQHR